ncbi:MAG TPA: gas vesicle protein GvpG [Candidatus Binataceae bacterium]|nr:gas vesicle protein GvpG [Candidatus Binataceae bacterium]
MFLIDDLLLAPGKFVLWVLRQVHEAAEKELDQEGERLTAELGELHRRLEARTIGEREFDLRERKILDRLEELKSRGAEREGRQADEDG